MSYITGDILHDPNNQALNETHLFAQVCHLVQFARDAKYQISSMD